MSGRDLEEAEGGAGGWKLWHRCSAKTGATFTECGGDDGKKKRMYAKHNSIGPGKFNKLLLILAITAGFSVVCRREKNRYHIPCRTQCLVFNKLPGKNPRSADQERAGKIITIIAVRTKI